MDFNLLNGCYSVCNFCKEGQFFNDENEIDEIITTNFQQKHLDHGSLEIIPAAKFLSEKLQMQYIDIDRPELVPIITQIGAVSKKDVIDTFKAQRKMRREYLTQEITKKEIKNHVIDIYLKTWFKNNFCPKIETNCTQLQFTQQEWLIPLL